jgi:hypothetical protein
MYISMYIYICVCKYMNSNNIYIEIHLYNIFPSIFHVYRNSHIHMENIKDKYFINKFLYIYVNGVHTQLEY